MSTTLRHGLGTASDFNKTRYLSPAHEALASITLIDKREAAFVVAMSRLANLAISTPLSKFKGSQAEQDALWLLYVKHCMRPDMPHIENGSSQVHWTMKVRGKQEPNIAAIRDSARLNVEMMGVRRRAAAMRVIYGEDRVNA